MDRGGTAELAAAMLDPLRLQIVDFDRVQAMQAGQLRDATRVGLSIGDRACLSLALGRRLAALTTDRAWTDVALDIEIVLLR